MLCLLVFAGRALGAEPASIGVRAGNHPDFGRLVFDVPAGTHYQASRDGDQVVLLFVPARPLGATPALPRNVNAMAGDAQKVVVRIAPGATWHDMRLGDHVVLDVFDPAQQRREEQAKAAQSAPRGRSRAPVAAAGKPAAPDASTPPGTASAALAPPSLAASRHPSAPFGKQPPGKQEPAAKQEPPRAAMRAGGASPPSLPGAATAATGGKSEPSSHAPAMPAKPPPAQAAMPDQSRVTGGAPGVRTQAGAGIPATRAPSPAEPQPVVSGDPATPVGALGLVATLVPPPAGLQGAAFTLPFETGVGAAAFRREDTDYVVLDAARPVDLSALRHSKLLWSAGAHILPAATLIRLRLPQGMTLRLFPQEHAWLVAAVDAAPPPAPIGQRVGDGRLTLAAADPGGVVTLADPETGATLLVGTQRRAGQAIAVRRTGPDFTLLPSWQGVLVEALSDRLALRAVPDGFVLGAEPGRLAISPLTDDALADAAALTRRFRFPALPTDILQQRITRTLEQAATTPVLARGPLRRAIALDMITVGLDAEAEGLLHVAMQEDPKQAASSGTAALAAIAALLADRPEEAEAINDPRLAASDEITFWRAVRLAELDDASPQAAASFAVTAPLALDYPASMRDKLLPLVLETMLRGGQAPAAQALLARCGKLPGLEMARAMAEEEAGKVDAALQAYDAITHGADQLASARAAVHALELRLRLGRMSEQRAADGLDHLLYAWRGDRHDLAVRERLAELRQQSGAWRAALTVLRDAERDFPAQQPQIRVRMQQVFAALLRDGGLERLPPLELGALADENADLLPSSADGEKLQARLADRLLALDLPDRAGPVLEKLMHAAPSPAARAGFGVRLAAMRLHEGDAAAALQALLASAASGLPPELAQQRLLLFAAATARRGDSAAALAALADMHGAAADAARADIMEQAQDWPGADRALTAYVASVVPSSGTLNDTQRQALLRLATAAARAGDAATLASLSARESVRMGSGPLADMFRLLTAPPVRGTADLVRARREVGLARTLPADLKAVSPEVATH